MNLALAPTVAPDRRRWMALFVVCLAQLMIVLDVTIVNVALPSIQHDLHFSQANLTWVVNAFLITFGSLLLLAGRLGDLAGRKRVFLAGLTTADLARTVDLAIVGYGQVPLPLFILTFVGGHAAMHTGEISCLKGLQGLRGYPT